MVGNNILDNVETQMISLIGAMSEAAGFNYDWAMVNEEDETIGDFPRAVINPTDSVADKETNVDERYGKSNQDYTNEVLFTIMVAGLLTISNSSNPNFEGRSIMRLALDDLKMLFGSNNTVNGSCDHIMFAASQIEPTHRNDPQRPLRLRTVWKVLYSQDRKNPSQYASS